MYISTSADQNIKILSITHDGCNQITTYIDSTGNIKVKRGLVLPDGTTIGSVLNSIDSSQTNIQTAAGGGSTTVNGKSGTSITLSAADLADLSSLTLPLSGGTLTGQLNATTISATTVSAGSFGVTATAGSYAKVTVNAKGQVTAGTTLTYADTSALCYYTTVSGMKAASGSAGKVVATADPIFLGEPQEFSWNTTKSRWGLIPGQAINLITSAQTYTPTSAIVQSPVSITLPVDLIGDTEVWNVSWIFEKTVSSTSADTAVGVTIGSTVLNAVGITSGVGTWMYNSQLMRTGTSAMILSTDPFKSGLVSYTLASLSFASTQTLTFKYTPGAVGGTYKLHKLSLTRVL